LCVTDNRRAWRHERSKLQTANSSWPQVVWPVISIPFSCTLGASLSPLAYKHWANWGDTEALVVVLAELLALLSPLVLGAWGPASTWR